MTEETVLVIGKLSARKQSLSAIKFIGIKVVLERY
jgi:hypothetical protein